MSNELMPFHEAIEYVIYQANSKVEMFCLAKVIKATIIPKNHDEIIAAWNSTMKLMFGKTDDLGVPAHLLEQKQQAEKEAAAKNELQMQYINLSNDYDFDDVIRFCLKHKVSIQSRNKRDMAIAVKISQGDLEKLVELPFRDSVITGPTSIV
jgi:hypothetical protein